MEKKMFARYPIGNPRRKWRQDNFILAGGTAGVMNLKLGCCTAWHLEKTRRAVETAADAGFTVVGTTWARKEVIKEIVRTAERVGIRVLYGDFMSFSGMGLSKKTVPKHNPEDILAAMQEVKNWKSVVGYMVYDEPVTEEQRKIACEMRDIVERERPDMWPFIVSAAGKERIETMMEQVDPSHTLYDIYPLGNTRQKLEPQDQLDHFKMWYYFELCKNLAAKTGAPFGFCYQGHELFYTPRFDQFTFAAGRMMANAALLYGAKYLSTYTDFNGVYDPETGGHGPYFEEQKALNREISVLGNVLMALECKRVIHDESLWPQEIEEDWEDYRQTMEDSELLTGTLDPRTSIAEHCDADGHRYLMVLNRDYKNEKNYRLLCKEPSRVYRVDSETGLERLAFEGEAIRGHLEPGCMALYRLQPLDDEPYLLEYYLEKD